MRMLIAVCATVMVLAQVAFGQTTRYVKSGATIIDGTSWATAYPSLRHALAQVASTPGDVILKVWAETQYVEDPLSPSRDDNLQLRSNLTIIGGFDAGSGGTIPGEASTAYPSATWGHNTSFNAGGTIISGVGPNFVPAYNLLEGTTLTNVTLQYLSFRDGYRHVIGGGDPPFVLDGGAVYFDGSTDIEVKNCEFIGNFAADGAGAYIRESEAIFKECFFSFNESKLGNGAALMAIESTTRCLSTVFANNRAVEGGAVFLQDPVLATITDASFRLNSADFGGGLCAAGGETEVSVCKFKENKSITDGGGIAAKEGQSTASIRVASSSFWGNEAEVVNPSLLGLFTRGGGIYSQVDSVLVNNSFTSNYADLGGAMFFEEGTSQVQNSIAWNNEDDAGVNTFGSAIDFDTVNPPVVTIERSDISQIPTSFGNTNFSIDPQFPASPGYDPTGPLDNTSPCINTGNDFLVPPDGADSDDNQNYTEGLPDDVMAAIRIQQGQVDRGSHESPVCPCRSDFNMDGDTGTDADIEAFFACLGGNCCQTCAVIDVNCDGDDGTDADIEMYFLMLAGHGPCEP
jgi:predicted outer membrane repeat protein